ncbi:GNAT family N-acetyltransferase [Amycolatopsis sp.]|jgi:GNAT superfamily N-acetyltransferase|uniref:GNAT family N-acetyltransferase n=1 Tax=Amycolatopsis sp. TaxID=37632 RepID=UPI002DFD0AB5|nr:GNAT family N-acetyltransferase [Amycolatopsis sp.]
MELTWRPLSLDDTEQLAGVFAAAEAVDPTCEHYSAEDLREDFDAPTIDLADSSTAIWDGEKLVGYALVRPREAANPAHMIRIEAVVHPGYRDDTVGAHLVDWFERTGKLVHARTFPDAPLELHAHAHESQRWYLEVMEKGGFHTARTFLEMRADLAKLPPAQPLPEEFPLVGFEQKYDELTRVARNDTFGDHWGSTELSPEMWRHLVTGSKDFRPDLSFLLLSPSRDEVVAFVTSEFFKSDAEVTGIRDCFVDYVGTRASVRGRGVATALLGHTLAKAKEAGFQRSSLSVDLENVNGALGIYERCGYVVAERWSGLVRAFG